MSWAILMHSQKGSEWKHHDYIKREGTEGHYEDGKYYYPDSYKGGRHLPKGDSKRKSNSTGDTSNMQDWERKVHEHLAKIIAEHPDMFKTGKDVVAGIMDDKNLQAVKNTLKAFGLDTDKMSDAEVKVLRRQIADYYDKKAADAIESGASKSSKSGKSGKSSKSKGSSEKEAPKKKKRFGSNYTAEEEKRKGLKRIAKNKKRFGSNYIAEEEKKKKSSKKKTVKHSVWYISSTDSIAHHGVLGQRHGVRNGPPYPLGAGDHSASEKKAGWRDSLANGVKKVFRSKRQKELDKQAKRLSDDELEKENKRIERENHYSKQSLGKQARNMTDSELQAAVKRLQIEKQYVDLSSEDISKGKNFSRKMLIKAGTLAATTLVTAIAVKAGQKGADTIINKASGFAKEKAKDAAKEVTKSAAKQAAKTATTTALAVYKK